MNHKVWSRVLFVGALVAGGGLIGLGKRKRSGPRAPRRPTGTTHAAGDRTYLTRASRNPCVSRPPPPRLAVAPREHAAPGEV
jgi:hypothetical protein